MDAQLNKRLELAVSELPAELRDEASRWFEQIEASHDCNDIKSDTIGTLVRLVACSQFAAKTVMREWEWFTEHQDSLQQIHDSSFLEQFSGAVVSSTESIETVKQQLRCCRHRYMVQILWREIAGIATLDDTLVSLSDLADHLLDAAARYAERSLHERHGVVRGVTGDPVSLVILGMGKLGGHELNFSSDIDLIFLYPEGSDSDGERSLSAPEYFSRVSRVIIALLDEATADGFAFRIDTRLRPFGDSGPPVLSFAALESYLLQHGRNWERYAYVKARIVGPQPPPSVAVELCGDLIRPFVFRRYLDYGVFESLRKMHALISAEVTRRDMADNVKLGPGGIREIEFIVQSLQLVRGGSQPELQERGLRKVIPRLIGDRGLTQDAADSLLEAYGFLRRIENFVQAIRDQQTHELPTDDIDRTRLCVAMRFPDWMSLRSTLDAHRAEVSRQFVAIAFRGGTEVAEDVFRDKFEDVWSRDAGKDEWERFLAAAGFGQADELALELQRFGHDSVTTQIDSTSRQRLRQFMPNLLSLLLTRQQPAVALSRSLLVVEKVLRRSAYLALLNENQAALGRLVELCEKSAYVAERLARYPVLLDELLDPRIYTGELSRMSFTADLRQRLMNCSADAEAQMETLGKFQRANQFRIAVADFYDTLPIMKVSDALTELAETVLQHALKVAWQDLVEIHGAPSYVVGEETRQAGFGVIAYGKLGGLELSYGSDLDIVFLHDSSGRQQMTNGAKPLDNSVFFNRLVRRMVHFLTTQTGSGIMYEIDMRLRPDGQSGLLVSSVDAFERYQQDHAWTWEHQALLRARPVAGSEAVAEEFERIRRETLKNLVRRDSLREGVEAMRRRMRSELDKSDGDLFDIKQGGGGIGDIEFTVQYLVLRFANEHPGVTEFSDNIRQLDALADAGCLGIEVATRLQDIYKIYRQRVHHLVLDNHKPLVPVGEFEHERKYVRSIWQEYLMEASET
ncbi:MAG: bifunctional [glutamate--ammonia ligase]-adenylyl-L-tyrosine phosphorylase/[glutamate--ammonia-ligase] adenylyltransferase [Desulfobulbaceae bacterium]|nr:bifunctional [glutamate--ammonia ligase]-adenylyl-L-tyrosine phosphorylase/[glutamate--ammonia-ligase] adenylyltransferase [Desulfobulbaceae bacterium]